MKYLIRALVSLLAQGFPALLTAQAGAPPSPFTVTATMQSSNASVRVAFHFEVPREHFLYASRLVFQTEDGKVLSPSKLPETVLHRDKNTGAEKAGYDHPFAVELEPGTNLPANLVVKFQGCNNSACYFPERHIFSLSQDGIVALPDAPVTLARTENQSAATAAGLLLDTNGFKLVARETGYIPKATFAGFLQKAKTGQADAPESATRLERLGPTATLLLIVVGGLGLNLTPCVLPLIPINLAIIGAGARASSRRRGFALGGAYGVGMALVYGLLGLVVVLTGAKFGTLNSSAWFNLGIAFVFLVMALAMFDLVNVDFSRFQSGRGKPGAPQKGQFVLALTMGVMAALLAGACVAPVVISVLLLAAHLYSKGIVAGLLLPFLLGLGMALPWPFAGAGLSFLPKPGKWMQKVKYSFGVLILLFVAYYGHLGASLFASDHALTVAARSAGTSGSQASTPEAGLAAALRQSRAQGRPLLIDFAASWCKNCQAMDAAVFPAAEVKEQLGDFVVFRYAAEKPNESPASEILNRFGVMGLPTYVVLLPDK